MKSRLKSLLRRKRRLLRENLEVELPGQLPEDWRRDGVDLPEFEAKSMGQKASWLCQMLASVPPSTWEKHLEFKPAQAIQAALGHDWGQPLLHGWMLATARFRDSHWATAWITASLKEKPRADLAFELQLPLAVPVELTQRLWRLLEPVSRQALALQALQQAQSPDSNLQIFSLLLEGESPIPDPTAQAFAQQLQYLLQRFGNHMGYPFRAFLYNLPKLAALIRPDFYPNLRSVWANNPAHQRWYDQHLQGALRLLYIRYRWFQAIQ